jgi:hypothetical protein
LYAFLKRREERWTLQERREYFLDIFRYPRPSKVIYQVTIIVITEILSANGYRNPTSPNNY